MPVNVTARLLSSLLCLTSVFLMVGFGNQQSGTRTLIPAESFQQVPGEWDRYQLRKGEFSVQMPTIPAMISDNSSRDPKAKSSLLHLISSYSQGVVYAVYVYERKESLLDFIRRFGHDTEGNFTRQLDISGVGGREYSLQYDGGKRRTEYFITDRRIYVFKAQGSSLGNPDTGIPRFLDSIKFDRPVAGRVIVDGPGEQPRAEVNMASKGNEATVFKGREVVSKALVITRPEPAYTEAARNIQITGTVMLSCVFSSSGAVTNLQVSAGLPYGLTESAIAAARQMRFIPAIKDGHFVSMYMKLEYNFNLY